MENRIEENTIRKLSDSDEMMYAPWVPQPYLRRAWSPDRTCPQMRERANVVPAERKQRSLSAPIPCPDDICNDSTSSNPSAVSASISAIIWENILICNL